LEQLSPIVQTSPSLHEFATGVCVQPSCSSQSSLVQTLASSQSLGVPAQVAPEHESLTVHESPSSHAPVMVSCWHVPPEQVSRVHERPSSQLTHSPPFEPHAVGESTMHMLPEMQPLQQAPLRHSPLVQEPLVATHPPETLQVLHSPQSVQGLPTLPQALFD